MRKLAFIMCSAALLSGCSVGMALSGKQQPELGVVRVGATRGEVELQMGSPVRSYQESAEYRIDVYEYELGNQPSAGRAVGHAVMDVLTWGLWEIVGSPIEAFQGDKMYLQVTYDKNDVATKVRGTSQRNAP